ncbi:TIGR02186 family protein [Hyphomicrobium sp.]|jgi:uncharacterized protein (TIGR02186 family)|uniref:TIGR02186 family protein n=1 Tax=Hyphomicrobium sp. TaxID=82 RepID=UPI002C7EFB06|nr:TIGR02186 family protein [Hyphomicrobium sp.]HVZ05679.1 TIGR02186 family protein [Hyphomicrobium sp.]
MRRLLSLALFVPLFCFAGTAIAADAKESVEADASTRQVAITSSFTGTEILVFGAVENSVQPSAGAGTYDVVVVAEGTPAPVVVRRKSRVGGLWINTASMRFASLPSYYAIASTRPIDEIADAAVLDANAIGFEHVRMVPASTGGTAPTDADEVAGFKKALIRLKEKERLFIKSDFGVAFIGRSLFRATVALPPNVPVGPLAARIYLFRDGKLLGQYKSKVTLEREGVERYIHDAAQTRPLLYGLVTVFLAITAGLAAAFAFPRSV